MVASHTRMWPLVDMGTVKFFSGLQLGKRKIS